MKNIKELTTEKFKQIEENQDQELINNIAFAHGCADSQGKHLYFKAFGHYPAAYKVTQEQINHAARIRDFKIRDAIKQHSSSNNLIFIGMGYRFEPVDKGHIGNHRIRARFINNDGIICFIEVGTCVNDKSLMRCDHSIYNYCDSVKSLRERDATEKNNFKGLEHSISPEYTYKNLLELVNKTFNCSFDNIIVDEYLLNCDIFASISKEAKKGGY